MQLHRLTHAIFTKGSKNFYLSSIFFKKQQRMRVAILYAFVRTADDFIDAVPPQVHAFDNFYAQYHARMKGNKYAEDEHTPVINAFIQLQRMCQFDPQWIEAFFHSMRMDISVKAYDTTAHVIEYTHGSAEVVGLCMTRTLNISRKAHKYAVLFGRALQYINFIRDINEDNEFGRRYLPLSEGLQDLREDTARENKESFVRYIRAHIAQFNIWLTEGQAGLQYVDLCTRIPIKTAGNIFSIIARKIYRNPLLVYERKVSLSKPRILLCAIKNALVVYVQACVRAIVTRT